MIYKMDFMFFFLYYPHYRNHSSGVDMTITIAWVKEHKDTKELVIISDSRLRSHGAMDQCQKIFPLERGDCCLGFCGDAQVAYPLSVQASSVLNNQLKSGTRSFDALSVKDFLGKILNNLINSWDLGMEDKKEELKETNIFFGGWSWKINNFFIGYFKYTHDGFVFQKKSARLPHPFIQKNNLYLFIGDYKEQFDAELKKLLEKKFHIGTERTNKKMKISLEYEPLLALNNILNYSDSLPLIGGQVQMVKIYKSHEILPFVFRKSEGRHYLFGREMFLWEKTEKPIFFIKNDFVYFSYPLSLIPETSNYKDSHFK